MSAEVYAEDGYFAVIPEWVLDADVSAQAIRLYAVLRRYADQRTGHAHPSRRTLADRLLVSDVKVVDRALADLRRIGAVTVYPRVSEDGDRSSNGYLLHRAPQGGGPNAITPSNGTGGGGPEGRTLGRVNPEGGGPNALTVGAEKGEEPQPVEPQPRNHRTPLPPAAAGEGGQLALVPHPPGRTRLTGDAAFDAFWAAYPKRTGKDAARRAWAKAVKRTDVDKILTAVAAYPFDVTRLRYEKDPATWLNAGCWEDDPEAVAAARREPRTASGRLAWTPPPRGSYDAGDGTF